jgi:hypothetical protein
MEKLSELHDALNRNGFQASIESDLTERAVVNSVFGVRTDRGKTNPASPMSPNLALMQNLEGVLGSKNPPAIADIIEVIYKLGSKNSPSLSVANLWRKAAEYRLTIDPVLASIDSAFGEVVFGDALIAREESTIQIGDSWIETLESTPFTWFSRMWDKLTSEEWVSALPARVWTDWATALLRMAYGLCFLWEAAWYDAVARTIVSGTPSSSIEVKGRMEATLPWRKRNSGAEIRDFSSILIARCERAAEIRQYLDKWVDTNKHPTSSFEEEIAYMSADAELILNLKKALLPKKEKNVGKGLKEAIRYALITRDSSGVNSDYYGLLKSSGTRYLFPDPGIEWAAVIASLSCSGPGSHTYVGVVASNLSEAGLRPELEELIELLERAGLARGSADADQGVIVEAAY